MRKSLLFWVFGAVIGLSLLLGGACSDDEDDGDNGTPTDSTAAPPSGESPGVTDTEVILGTHTSLTGPIAAYSIIPKFTKAYFDHINETEGGVNGRTITYIQKDDQYSPPAAVSLTRELVEQDGIFAMFNALGTPNHQAVFDYLETNGVPDMYVATGATQWVNDPAENPLVFGSNPNYTGEGVALGKWILETMGADATAGIIYQNDDFGIDGAAGVKLAMGDQVVNELPYEVTDVDLTSQLAQLRSDDVDAVVMFVTPAFLGTGIKHARADLGWDVQFVVSSVSMNELTGIIAGAENIEGTVGPVATYMAQQTDNAGIAAHVDLVANSGIADAAASVLTLYAQYVAEMMVETLSVAGQDLTRDSLIDGAQSLTDWLCSVCLFPVTLSATDHDPAQSVAMGVYQSGLVTITDVGYTWEGVSVDDLSLDAVQPIEVPADAVNAQ